MGLSELKCMKFWKTSLSLHSETSLKHGWSFLSALTLVSSQDWASHLAGHLWTAGVKDPFPQYRQVSVGKQGHRVTDS